MFQERQTYKCACSHHAATATQSMDRGPDSNRLPLPCTANCFLTDRLPPFSGKCETPSRKARAFTRREAWGLEHLHMVSTFSPHSHSPGKCATPSQKPSLHMGRGLRVKQQSIRSLPRARGGCKPRHAFTGVVKRDLTTAEANDPRA